MYVTTDRALNAGADRVAELADRAEILDALYRFGLGQDLGDRELLASAFAPDATLDFRPTARVWGAEPEPMRGREAIADAIIAMFADRVDTTHTVTNPRIDRDGDSARLTALVEAQHLLSADHSTFALLKNLYDVRLERSDGRWLITHMRIANVWLRGEPKAIFG